MRYVRLYIRRKYYFIIYVISSLLNAPLFICLCVVLHLTSSVSVSFCFFLFLCLRIRLILSSPGSAFAVNCLSFLLCVSRYSTASFCPFHSISSTPSQFYLPVFLPASLYSLNVRLLVILSNLPSSAPCLSLMYMWSTCLSPCSLSVSDL